MFLFLFTGYRQLFQPVIKQVVDFYQPTCIVLQVRLLWVVMLGRAHGAAMLGRAHGGAHALYKV